MRDAKKVIQDLKDWVDVLELAKEAVHLHGTSKNEMADLLKEAVELLLAKKPALPRAERNALIETLATINGCKLSEVGPPMFARCAKALKDIQAVCPTVTVEEIKRRARIYREKWPERELTATALSTWWAACGSVARPGLNGGSDFRQGDNLRLR